MKRLCCSNFSTLTLLLNVSLMASLSDKSTMIYCGENISYLMVGIHDYIVVNSENTNTITHEFSAYKHKMYIHISQDTNELESVTNARFKEGCEKFFLNMRDRGDSKIKLFHICHPQNKLIVNGKFDILGVVDRFIKAVVFDVELDIKSMEQKIIKSQSYGLDVIQIEYMLTMQSDIVQENIMKAKEARVVPYLIGSAFDNLKPTFHFHEECTLDATPKNYKIIVNGENVNLEFKNSKKAVVNVLCR